MNFKKLSPLVIAGLLIVTVISCGRDPWVLGDGATDKVTITKITKFGTASDGSPFKGNVGAVVMSHKTHEDAGLTCYDCHHKNSNPEREKVCAKCHIGDNGYETMHGLCLDCHIGKKEGPQKCMECH